VVGVHRLPERASRPFERTADRSQGTYSQAGAQAWDDAVDAIASPAPLNQSWAWGEVQAAAGWTPQRLYFTGLGPIQMLVERSGPIRWGYVPRGPVGCTGEMLEALVDWSRRAGLARLRVEPELGPEVCPVLAGLGFRRVKDVQPSRTRLMPIATEHEMLASFRRTTRYNIHYAERSQVVVEEGADAAELALQVRASAARAGVSLPGTVYFRTVLQRLPLSRTLVARHDGESLCALLVAVHDGRGYYLFSGSNGRHRNLKAMDLTMWRAIQYAARMGCRDYDLWGVSPDDDPAHPWHGFTEFKRGYGGEVVEYAGTWDLELSAAGCVALMARERAVQAYRRARFGARRSFI
jgi:hypothetical protein